MIYVQNPRVKEKQFTNLLEKTKLSCLKEIAIKGIRRMDGVPFEDLVYKKMCLAAVGSDFEGEVKQTGKQTFPDIIANKYYGVEVKVTAEDKWVSTGNSVTESTRVKDVERIYMFFGKFGGTTDIKYRCYQDCLSDVGVTHSPRYKIDMNLPSGQSIFSKIGIEYNVLRKQQNPIKTIKSYYRKLLAEGEELWWMDSRDEEPVITKIVPYHALGQDIKNRFFVEAIALFPEVADTHLANKRKYERAAAYLITKYNSFNSSFRDIFSAGIKDKPIIGHRPLVLPNVLTRLYLSSKAVKDYIERAPEEDLLYYWKLKRLTKPRVNTWLGLLDARCLWKEGHLKASDIFKAGLDAKKN